MSRVIRFFSSTPCHICGSSDKVNRKNLPVVDRTGTREVTTEHYKESDLCQKCDEDGWELIIDRAVITGESIVISYSNWYSNETKTVRFPVHA